MFELNIALDDNGEKSAAELMALWRGRKGERTYHGIILVK
jgi:hypothetical protein